MAFCGKRLVVADLGTTTCLILPSTLIGDLLAFYGSVLPPIGGFGLRKQACRITSEVDTLFAALCAFAATVDVHT